MIAIRKTRFFKLTSCLLVALFIFQVDFLLYSNNRTDAEQQFEKAKTEEKHGEYQASKKRLDRLIPLLNQEKQKELFKKTTELLKQVNHKIEEIEKAEELFKQAQEDYRSGKYNNAKEKLCQIILNFKKEEIIHENLINRNYDLLEQIRKKLPKSSGKIILCEGKKKKKFPWLLVVGGTIAAGALVYFLVIKKAKKYNLTVNKGVGVDGTPDNGTYTYKKGEIVNYSYRLQAGYTDLLVTLDGNQVPAAGTIKMDNHHTLAASTSQLGSIKVESTPTGASIWLDGTDTGQKTNTVLVNIIPGVHTIKLTKKGYADYETTVNAAPGQQAAVSATLEFYLGIEWVTIPAGEFKMGDNFNEGDPDEKPVHTVYLNEYNISRYEVTFEQYDKFCQETGRTKPGDEGWGRGKRPVINVSWYDAKAFCDWLSQKTGTNIYLPTEAQWEKAARGTNQQRYPWGNSSPSCSLANHSGCGSQTKPVGSHPQGVSPYGLHDMAGNVWEWCSDWYSSAYYSISPGNNPTGPSSGSERVLRGGSWISNASSIRSASRFQFDPQIGRRRIGFRICQDQILAAGGFMLKKEDLRTTSYSKAEAAVDFRYIKEVKK